MRYPLVTRQRAAAGKCNAASIPAGSFLQLVDGKIEDFLFWPAFRVAALHMSNEKELLAKEQRTLVASEAVADSEMVVEGGRGGEEVGAVGAGHAWRPFFSLGSH